MELSKAGGIRVILELANGLVKHGHRVTILLTRQTIGTSFPLDEGVQIKQSIAKKSVLGELWWLIRNIPNDSDIVVANYYLTSYPTAIVTFFSKKKGFYFIQDYEPDFFIRSGNGKLNVVKRMLAIISYYLPLCQITISSWLQDILYGLTRKKAFIINDGVDTDLFSTHRNDKNVKDVKCLMCFGRKDQRKGFSDLLDAVHILSRKIHLKLLIVTQDKDFGVILPVPIEIVSPSNDDELANCYRRADVFAFPSLREGFGLPPLEAMACGTPVVTTDCGGVLEYAEDSLNCLVVPVANPEAMAEGIRKILDDDDLALRLSQAGRKTACRFTWGDMVTKFESLLDKRY